MDPTETAKQVERLSALKKDGYRLDPPYVREMTRTLLATFTEGGAAERCIDDMLEGERLPNPRAIKDWARQHGVNKRLGDAGWGRAAAECPVCDGSGVVDVSGVRTEGIFAGMPATSVKRCECRRTAVG